MALASSPAAPPTATAAAWLASFAAALDSRQPEAVAALFAAECF